MSLPPPADPSAQPTIDSPPIGGAPARPPHKEPEQIGPYRILERIGEGGMGVIYKAEQRSPVRRVVALKVIKLGMDTKEVLARFDAERQALALMNHPNIARVVDAGVTETGRPYFAMEFVPGVPLTRYCDEQKLSTRERLGLFEQVCNAIHHAHQKGIIHRDLKPSNILVTLVDGKPVPKVIDFGIAKATTSALTAHTLYTQTGALIGTPEYMSPEQAQTSGLDVDTRTDIYSLGVILYELLTGTLPFDPKALRTAGREGMARMIRESEPQKPSTRLVTVAGSGGTGGDTAKTRDTRVLERELRGDLDWIVLKAMEKDRTRRYESAASLAQDVERHLKNEPVLARPPSATYRVGKFVRRHRAGVIGAAAVAAALILGIVGTTVGLLRAREQRDRARNAELEAVEQMNVAKAAREDARNANLFLRDLLMSFGNPRGGRAGVERAVRRLDEGWLKDQPDTQLASRIALGYFFIEQNDTARADRQFEAALALARRPDGSVPPEVSATVSGGRGMAFWMRKNLPEAERYLRQAIEDYRKVPGAESNVVQMLMGLAAVRQAAGQPEDGLKYFREAERIAATQPALQGVLSMYGAGVASITSPANATGSELLEAGKFAEALPHYVKACRRTPSSHWDWYHRACIHLYLGDESAYREAALGMLERFGGTSIASVGERTAKVCLLTPRPVGDMAQLQRLIDQALASDEAASMRPWFAMAKALAHYRAGEYASAIQFLDQTRTISGAPAQATTELIRAMVEHHQGQTDAAKRRLEAASALMERELAKPGIGAIQNPENWLICHILKREAEQLIAGKK
jgi:serine/threonine protein kinase/tetratricopeptide (TPR) repeat protein